MHMSIGIVIFVLMVGGGCWFGFLPKSRRMQILAMHCSTKGAIAAHYVLYAAVIAMAASWFGRSPKRRGCFDIVFGGSGEALPVDFSHIAPRAAHGILAIVLSLTIAAHVLAALYHQYIRKDSLFSRMWFGGR